MAIGAKPPSEGYKHQVKRVFDPTPRPLQFPLAGFMLPPQTALFLAIDLHCHLQGMDSTDDEVVYYVNRDFSGWVEQRVTRRVYIELKLECTRNRKRDNQKARDDWLCLYCGGSFPSKLRLTDHRVVGCPCGPVDSRGQKWQLPVYPNLKTAKQGKDLKLALERGSGDLWDTLQHNPVWMELNPELRDPSFPPAGAKVEVRRFMEPTLDVLTANPKTAGGSQPCRSGSQRAPKPRTAAAAQPAVVDLSDDINEDIFSATPRPRKRPHAHMEGDHGVHFSPRQFRRVQPEPVAEPSSRDVGAERYRGNARRASRPSTAPPPQPIRVAPIQSRSPSPDRAIILGPPTPVPHVPEPASMPEPTHVSTDENAGGEEDVAAKLRKDRHAYYGKAASAARASVKMETVKPPLMPPMLPPGLFHLLPCGLLKADLESGNFPAFQAEVENWRKDPTCLDRLYAAYGRFYSPAHQVTSLFALVFIVIFWHSISGSAL